jgi:hypothetical protein
MSASGKPLLPEQRKFQFQALQRALWDDRQLLPKSRGDESSLLLDEAQIFSDAFESHGLT